jgi:N-acetylglucosaminyldiphosphoundecaprenol N-acetyl-beta-D-mannosaminyltransferase
MDDFDRNVYCVAGLPFDAVDMTKTLNLLRHAKHHKTNCFLTTPNLNFLAIAQTDKQFRQSVIHSDIVIADGLPIVWIAKLLGMPITHRVAGSTLFENMGKETRRKMKVYFFGGMDGVAAAACHHLNANSKALSCVGFHSPGFGSIEEMSQASIIEKINQSQADFLVVALGARKGQEWIVKNRPHISIPLVSHLGAVINFEAKKLKRAPGFMQNIGLEWLWRIKEEPSLWKRYFKDGIFFCKLLTTKLLPLALWLRFNKKRLKRMLSQSEVNLIKEDAQITMKVNGVVCDPVTPEIRDLFRQVSHDQKSLVIDLTDAQYVSFGFLGLALMLKKHFDQSGLTISIQSTNSTIDKILDWNGLNYLKG